MPLALPGRRWLLVPLVALLFLPVGLPNPAKAASDDGSPLSIVVAPQKSEVMVGEPIVLRYTVRNRSSETLPHIRISDRGEWVRFRLTDAKGKTLSEQKELVESGGIFPIVGPIPPGGTHSGVLVISPFVMPSAPGHFVLKGHARIMVLFPARPTATAEIRMPITAVAADPDRLRRLTRDLHQTAANSNNWAVRYQAAESLLCLPEEIAGPYWDDLARPKSRPPAGRELPTLQVGGQKFLHSSPFPSSNFSWFLALRRSFKEGIQQVVPD